MRAPANVGVGVVEERKEVIEPLARRLGTDGSEGLSRRRPDPEAIASDPVGIRRRLDQRGDRCTRIRAELPQRDGRGDPHAHARVPESRDQQRNRCCRLVLEAGEGISNPGTDA